MKTMAMVPPRDAVFHPLQATVEPPYPNPLKGLIPFFDSEPLTFPHSMEWVYWKLSDVVVGADSAGNNRYDWRRVDSVLDDVAKRGHQACIRFYTYYPDDPTRTGALPVFLKPRIFKVTEGAIRHEVPDFNDPQVLRCLLQFIKALADRYDHPTPDPRIGFITAGLVGFWGEWHVYTGVPGWNEQEVLSDATKGRLAKAFQDNFRNLHVMLRYPLSANELKQGAIPTRSSYHDDAFAFETTGPDRWAFANRLQRGNLLKTGAEIWRTKPIGGEIYPPTQDDVFRSGSKNYQKWKDGVAAVHPSWMIAARVFEASSNPKASDYTNVLKEAARLGYNIRATDAYFVDKIAWNSALYIGLKLANDGIAPFYYPWKLQVGLRHKDTRKLTVWNTDWDVRTVAADNKARPFEFSTGILAARGLVPGAYSIVLRLLHPLSQKFPATPPFRFANKEQGEDGWLVLGSLALTDTKS